MSQGGPDKRRDVYKNIFAGCLSKKWVIVIFARASHEPARNEGSDILFKKKSWTVLSNLKIIFALEKTVILIFLGNLKFHIKESCSQC